MGVRTYGQPCPGINQSFPWRERHQLPTLRLLFLWDFPSIMNPIYIYISVSPIDIGDSYLLRSWFQVCVWKSVVCTPNTSSWDSNVVNNGKTLRAASNAHLFHNCGSINIVSLDLSSFPWTSTPLHLGLCCSKLPFLPEDHRLFLFPQCSWRELREEGKRSPWLHTIPGAANS